MLTLRTSRHAQALILLLGVILVGSPNLAVGTALDDYVAAPDTHYTYGLDHQTVGPGYNGYILNLTSQAWRSSAEVDRTLWQHWLSIVVPLGVSSPTAMLIIDGGDNGGSAPLAPDGLAIYMALNTQSVVAHLSQVPNQPLTFADETEPRREDAILAYSFDKYLTTCDGTWPALLPMVKSAVRAMDTVQAFVPSVTGGSVHINQFVVTGASKRGWTTWLTAAVDARVPALAPLVIDLLNLDEQMDHHFAAYGFYSSAVQDYVNLNIFGRMFTPAGQALLAIIDPYEYRDRFSGRPVYAINSSGDQFFLPDSAQFYFHDLPGEKHLRYLPNTNHSLNQTEALSGLLPFYNAFKNGTPRPRYSWTVEPPGRIVVQTVDAPTAVNLWQATATNARDFRLETLGPAWTSSPVANQGGGLYVGQVPAPVQGWTAFFVELIFPGGALDPFKFSTEVRVVPATLPYASDLDHDGDVDADDLVDFQACLTGPNVGALTGHCIVADFDFDGDVDQSDFGVFQRCINEPGIPTDPNCAN